ncbi:MAG: hypothetical protein ACUVTG_14235 [Candidatus Oleimicrobiaceae bacterium]
MITWTSREEIRRSIAQSELRLNLLRICAREPRTIHDLIHAPAYPGIETNLFSLQSEINVTVELGECKNRELLVRVGTVPDPIVPGGRTELLRTSLLAFLLSPELAYAEPDAYATYIESWFSCPEVLNDPGITMGPGTEWVQAMILAFPELAHRAFWVAHASANGPTELPLDLTEADRVRIFGSYYIGDLPIHPTPLGVRELAAGLRRPPLLSGWHALKRQGMSHPRGNLRGLVLALHLDRPRRAHGKPSPYPIAPLAGTELLEGRLRPMPLA